MADSESRSDDPDVIVDFQEQIGWRGKLSELMKVRRSGSANSPKRARKSGSDAVFLEGTKLL